MSDRAGLSGFLRGFTDNTPRPSGFHGRLQSLFSKTHQETKMSAVTGSETERTSYIQSAVGTKTKPHRLTSNRPPPRERTGAKRHRAKPAPLNRVAHWVNSHSVSAKKEGGLDKCRRDTEDLTLLDGQPASDLTVQPPLSPLEDQCQSLEAEHHRQLSLDHLTGAFDPCAPGFVNADCKFDYADPFSPTMAGLPKSLQRHSSLSTLSTTNSVVTGTTDTSRSNRWSTSTGLTSLTSYSSVDLASGYAKRFRPESRASSHGGSGFSSRASSRHAPLRLDAETTSIYARDSDADWQGDTYLADAEAPQSPSHLEGGFRRARRGRSRIRSHASAGASPLLSPTDLISGREIDNLDTINESDTDSESVEGIMARLGKRRKLPAGTETTETSTTQETEVFSPPRENRARSRAVSIASNTSISAANDVHHESDALEPYGTDGTYESDVTDYTEASLMEALEEAMAPRKPSRLLQSLLITVKEDAVALIQQGVRDSLTAYAVKNSEGAVEEASEGSKSPSGGPSGTHSSTRSAGFTGRSGGKKRPSSDEDGDEPDGRGDQDGDKRRKPNLLSKADLEERLKKKLACPFAKRYPDSEHLQKSCRGPGWPSVHRVKEHIYRRHQSPTYACNRCLMSFTDETKLREHNRAAKQCQVKNSPDEEEVRYITQTQERELRRRQRDIGEEARWFNAYRILFPDVLPEDMPSSPYYDDHLGAGPLDGDTVDAFRTFLVRELPSRITRDIGDYLRVQTGTSQMSDGVAEIVRRTIGEVLDGLPRLETPRNAEERDTSVSGNGDTPEDSVGQSVATPELSRMAASVTSSHNGTLGEVATYHPGDPPFDLPTGCPPYTGGQDSNDPLIATTFCLPSGQDEWWPSMMNGLDPAQSTSLPSEMLPTHPGDLDYLMPYEPTDPASWDLGLLFQGTHT